MRKHLEGEGPGSRRSFLRNLGAAAGMPIVGVPMMSALAEAAPAAAQATTASHPTTAASGEVAVLMELVRLRYGQYLDESSLPLVERGLGRLRRSADEILKVKISNGDAPDCLFDPDGL
jgi:hypothetical protein